MAPYRRNAAIVRADQLGALFEAKQSLTAEDGLSLHYELLPWKRHVFKVQYEPADVAEFLSSLAERSRLAVDIERSDDVTPGRYAILGKSIRRQGVDVEELQQGIADIGALARVQEAVVRAGTTRFGLEQGKLVFEISGFELGELASRFERRFPWLELGLPPLTGRDWSVLQRGR